MSDRWMFARLPKQNPLVGVRIEDMGVRERVRKLLPTSMCVLATGEDTFVTATNTINTLDILSNASAVGFLSKALGAPALDFPKNIPEGSTPVAALFRHINTVDDYVAAVSSLLHALAEASASVDIPLTALASMYRMPCSATFGFVKPWVEGDEEYCMDPKAELMLSRTVANDTTKTGQLLRWLRRCHVREYRITETHAGARDLQTEALVKVAVQNADVRVIPAATSRYSARSLFAVKLGTYAMGEAYRVAALMQSKRPLAAEEYMTDLLTAHEVTPSSFALPCDGNKQPTPYSLVYVAAMMSLLHPFKMHTHAGGIIAKLLDAGVQPISGMYMLYCATLAACAEADVHFLNSLRLSGDMVYGVDLALMLENGGTPDQIRDTGLRLVRGVQKTITKNVNLMNGDGTPAAMNEDNEEAIGDMLTFLADSLISADDEKTVRDIALILVERVGARGPSNSFVPAPYLMQMLRMQSQALYAQVFPPSNVFALPIAGYEGLVHSPLHLLLHARADSADVDRIIDAASKLSGHRSEFPAFTELLAESVMWQECLFPTAVLDAASDTLGFL